MKDMRWFPLLSVLLIVGANALSQSAPSVRTITRYGATGDGRTLDTEAINRAISECSADGGGTVVIPPGHYVSGSIQLLKNVTLHLEAGAVLAGSTNLNDYAVESGPGGAATSRAGLLTARDANNSAITGRGVIEGHGMAFIDTGKLKLHEGSDYDKKFTRQGEDFMNPKYGTEDGPFEPRDRPGNMIRFFTDLDVSNSGLRKRQCHWRVHPQLRQWPAPTQRRRPGLRPMQVCACQRLRYSNRR
jgi:hypothetical protein